MEIVVKIGSAAVSRTPQVVLTSVPDVISFSHTCKELYPEKFV